MSSRMYHVVHKMARRPCSKLRSNLRSRLLAFRAWFGAQRGMERSMHVLGIAASAATALAVPALLLAERAGSQRGVWAAKPLASLGFVATAWLLGAPASSYGQALLLGLGACTLGDVLLIPRGAGASFLAGMGSFALGHIAFAVAFAQHGNARGATWLALAAMALLAVFTLRWLAPRLPLAMLLPIRVYISVISLMVALAVGASVASGQMLMAAGAILFALSDLSVARERFVQPAFVNQLVGLPMYYAAQLLLAWSV
jgi:uncharacterized membrane protein YhhN